MKRLLLLLILFAMPAYAEEVQVARLSPAIVGGSVPGAAASCTTANDSLIVDRTDISTDGYVTIRQSTGAAGYQRLVLGATSYTITEYILYVLDSGEAGNIVGALYSSAGSEGSETVSTIIADTSVTVGNAAVGGTLADVTFTLTTPKTGQTGTIFVGFTADGTGAYFNSRMGSDSGYRMGYDAPISYVNNYSLTVAVYGCTE